MHPNGKPDDCLTQHHDPKKEEVSIVHFNPVVSFLVFNVSMTLTVYSCQIVRAEDCEGARKDKTNFWIMVNKRSGDDNGGGGDDDDDDPPPGSDTINDLGSEYCDTHSCKRCQGEYIR
jgi:hypothetical protein